MNRTLLRSSVVACALGLASNAQAQESNTAQDTIDLRSGAWDRSVELERGGDLVQALSLMQRAWGPSPESYEVTVRMAWLSLQLRRGDDAVRLYRRAMTLDGAGPEARKGLGSALSMQGYSRLADDNPAGALASWREALLIDPQDKDAKRGIMLVENTSPGVAPEVWLAYVTRREQTAPWNGWALFAHLPARLGDGWVLRGAFRHVSLSRDRPPPVILPGLPPAHQPKGKKESWSQNDIYVAAGIERRPIGAEVLAGGIFRTGEDAAKVLAGRLRLGWVYGVNLEGAALGTDAGKSAQVFPQAFWWPSRHIGLSLGPRLTSDAVGFDVSAVAGMTLRLRPITLTASGHYGKERWPVTMSTPSVLALRETAKYGCGVTAMAELGKGFSAGLSQQVESLELDGYSYIYGTIGAGLMLVSR